MLGCCLSVPRRDAIRADIRASPDLRRLHWILQSAACPPPLASGFVLGARLLACHLPSLLAILVTRRKCRTCRSAPTWVSRRSVGRSDGGGMRPIRRTVGLRDNDPRRAAAR